MHYITLYVIDIQGVFFEWSTLKSVRLHSTQLLGYKENPTVLDRVPMSTEGKLSRIQRGWF